MKIRRVSGKELTDSLPLIWRVFCEFEAVNYPENGKKAFYDAIHSGEYLGSLTAFGAFEKSELVGVIATRNEGTHLALFFC